MITVLKKFFRKISGGDEIEIDETIIKETRKLSETAVIKRCEYRSKDVSWLEGHLESVNNVVNNNSLGAKTKNYFEIDGRRYFKDDTTRVLFSRLFENYTAYYYTLKEYIDTRKELIKYNGLGSESFFVAGQVKDAEEQMLATEKKLNIYLDNITKVKQRIRQYIGI
ncbi:MAG: hypothetical protein WCX82_02255 [archaeon]|jgi:hypothetical protein